MKRALITGITGQDGSYLAELLLEKGYEVHGIVRRSSVMNRERIDHLTKIDKSAGYTGEDRGNLKLHHGDLTDSSSIGKIIKEVQPDEVYNLGAQSHVKISFEVPENTSNINALGTLRLLEEIKNNCPKARFYQASSSEMFGKVKETPQTENTPFNPRSPYACAKVHAYNLVVNYREAYGLHASNGILFNHESERRGESFVTRKITRSLTRIKVGVQDKLNLGNLNARRDWGHAKDYVKAMWLILQKDEPDDYIIGTGENHTVREFLEEVINYLGLDLKSNGMSGTDEKYLDKNGREVICIDKRYFRPSEVDTLLANPTKAKEKLGWETDIKFKDIVRIMTDHDLKLAEDEAYLNNKDTTWENKGSVREIKHNEEVIAIVFKKGDLEKGINFFTKPENALQTGILNHPKGHVILPHVHNPLERTVTGTQEVLYVEHGKVKVNLLTESGEKITEEILEPKDLMILIKKGHGFEMLENSKIIYVKQGPYADRDSDKRVF